MGTIFACLFFNFGMADALFNVNDIGKVTLNFNHSNIIYAINTGKIKDISTFYQWLMRNNIIDLAANFSHVLLPPHNISACPEYDDKYGRYHFNGPEYYSMGYGPACHYLTDERGNYTLPDSLEMGPLKELTQILHLLKLNNLGVSFDLVGNHIIRNGEDENGPTFLQYEFTKQVEKYGLDFIHQISHKDDKSKLDPIGPLKSYLEYGDIFHGFYNLVANHHIVVEVMGQTIYLFAKAGHKGNRLDYAKGLKPEYVALWYNKAKEIAEKNGDKDLLKNWIITVELWLNSAHGHTLENDYPNFLHDQTYLQNTMRNWYNEFRSHLKLKDPLISIKDFSLFAMMKQAFNTQDFTFLVKPDGTINGFVSDVPTASLFANNHDLWAKQVFPGVKPFVIAHGDDYENRKRVYLQAYAFILTLPIGNPIVYLADYMDDLSLVKGLPAVITELMKIRKEYNIGTNPQYYTQAHKDYFRMYVATDNPDTYLLLEMGPRNDNIEYHYAKKIERLIFEQHGAFRISEVVDPSIRDKLVGFTPEGQRLTRQ